MPQGWYGLICGICFEGMTPDDCFVDQAGDKWDFHPGRCAALSGRVPAQHQTEYDELLYAYKAAEGVEKRPAMRRYYAFIEQITPGDVWR